MSFDTDVAEETEYSSALSVVVWILKNRTSVTKTGFKRLFGKTGFKLLFG